MAAEVAETAVVAVVTAVVVMEMVAVGTSMAAAATLWALKGTEVMATARVALVDSNPSRCMDGMSMAAAAMLWALKGMGVMATALVELVNSTSGALADALADAAMDSAADSVYCLRVGFLHGCLHGCLRSRLRSWLVKEKLGGCYAKVLGRHPCCQQGQHHQWPRRRNLHPRHQQDGRGRIVQRADDCPRRHQSFPPWNPPSHRWTPDLRTVDCYPHQDLDQMGQWSQRKRKARLDQRDHKGRRWSSTAPC